MSGRLSWRALLLLSALPACHASDEQQTDLPPRPNIVVVLTDDQGLGDFGHAGHGALETPHLDRLARESPRVSRFYVSPVCSPTRASFLTGRYHHRTRVVDTWIGRSMMEPEETTLPELLRPAGYRTGIFGKWHLGDCYPMRPMDQGFDEVLVHRGGGLAQPSEPPANSRRYTDPILVHNGKEVETQGYCTNVYFDAALDFIDTSIEEGRPFLAYVAANAPHGPFHDVPEELYAKYRERDLAPSLRDKSDRVDREARICAMVENIDQNVGRLLAHLEVRGIASETLLIYFHDNGPIGGRYSAGLRGSKSSVYEGGIRSPLFVRWPSRLSPETWVEHPVAHIDLLPTLLEAAGIQPPADLVLDGRSILPLLAGESIPAERRDPAEEGGWSTRALFFQSHRGEEPAFEHHFAVIIGRWKLVRASGFGRHVPEPDHPFELYDLMADPSESSDLASEHPGIVDELRAAYAQWFADVSSTRPDNYARPPIVVGEPAETRTVLTRQDWRPEGGKGWGESGSWLLRSARPMELEATLLFTEEVAVDRVQLRMGTETRELAPESRGTSIALGRVRLPSGEVELNLKCYQADRMIGAHQLVLEQP